MGAFDDLAWVGFRTTAALAAAVWVAFIPLALGGRRFEPSRKSEAPGVIGGDWKVARRGFALV